MGATNGLNSSNFSNCGPQKEEIKEAYFCVLLCSLKAAEAKFLSLII